MTADTMGGVIRHLDLFSGIGGFALAVRWLGGETVAFCEIDPYCRRVLAKHWPEVPIHEDVRTMPAVDADLLTAWVPCQPASVAGKRRGSDDDRWLWPATFDVVRRVRPHYALLENVAGLIGLQPHGLDWVCAEMEAAGYAVVPVVLGADSVGAPHRRERVWIACWRRDVADADGAGREEQRRPEPAREELGPAERGGGPMADAQGGGLGTVRRAPWSGRQPDQRDEGAMGDAECGSGWAGLCPCDPTGQRWRRSGDAGCEGAAHGQPEPGLGRDPHGIPAGMVRRWPSRPGDAQHEWEPPRTKVFERSSGRSPRLKALGNSIVPHAAYTVLMAMLEAA